MHLNVVLFSVILYSMAVNARHYSDRGDSEVFSDDGDDKIDNIKRSREHAASQLRHRRRSYHTNYGYDYMKPPNPYYPDYRNDQSQQDLAPQIFKLLDEISFHVRRAQMLPPPLPQPIYIPYAVPYPVPQPCRCKEPGKSKPTSPSTIDNRFGTEDPNQNWGQVVSNEEEVEDGDGARPISFQPLVPKHVSKRPLIKVEHGSTQAGRPSVPATLGFSSPALPDMCEVFSLSCCTGTDEQQRQCFTRVGCAMTYNSGKGCNQQRILEIIDAYSKAYSPVH